MAQEQKSIKEGKVALITGASYGVGFETAVAFGKAGYSLILTATRLENLNSILNSLDLMNVKTLPLKLDLRSPIDIEKLLSKSIEVYGKIDTLINNAGANIRCLASEITREEWSEIIDINLTGTFFLTQNFGRYLINTKSKGSVITVASVHGLIGAVERSAYGISKSALLHMTKMLAIEWAEHQIRVNAVAPGRLNTASPSRPSTLANKEYMDSMLKRIPLHRLTTPEEVAQSILYLASPAASSITGQTIVLDGGITAGH